VAREVLRADGLHANATPPATTGSRFRRQPETVIIGGHLDSVPNGGWLDGPLGVLAGVDALRRYRQHDATGDDGASWTSPTKRVRASRAVCSARPARAEP
jgi:hypothetical protein